MVAEGENMIDASEDLRAQPVNNHEPVDSGITPDPVSLGAPIQSMIDSAATVALPVQEEALDVETLQAMGERLMPDRVLAAPIHGDWAIRVEEVIKKGLPAEEKKTLLLKFPPPENCLLMDPPILNFEVKACLQDTITKRDTRILEKQERITASLAAMAKLMSIILPLKTEERRSMIEIVSGCTRLLADLRHEENSIRRSLISTNIELSMREILNSTSSDKWLFAVDLEDKVKAARTLETSSNRFKPKPHQNQSNDLKNYKGPPRHQGYKRHFNKTSSGHKSTSQNQRFYKNRRPFQPKQNNLPVKKRD